MQNCSYTDECFYLQQCVENICVHKQLWPINSIEIIVYFLIPVIIGIANVGGLGGGVVKVPLLMLVLNYPQKIATYQAYCIMFGSVAPNVFLLFFQRHPHQNKPLIDFNIALVLCPTVILGTTIGYYINAALPDFVTIILFLVFLFIISPYLYQRGMELYYQEQNSNQQQLQEKNQNKQVMSNQMNSFDVQKFEVNELEMDEQKHLELQQILIQEQKMFPTTNLLIMISCFIIVQVLNFIRGDKSKSFIGIEKCSFNYWLITAIIVIIIIIYSIIIIYILKKQDLKKRSLGYKFDPQDIQFTNITFVKLFTSGCIAGLLSGALGAGAGLAVVPILLLLNVHPRVSSATSAFNYLWIALTLIINVFLGSLISITEIILFTSLSLIGGFGISKFIYNQIEKYKKSAIVVFFVFGISVLNIIGNVLFVFKQKYEYGIDSILIFPEFCK